MTPRISDEVIARMAPPDAERERRIRGLGERFLLARTTFSRRAAAERMAEEVKGRSPDAVAIIETAKGLR